MAYSSSASDRLTAVRAAIDKCLTSQGYTVRGRSQQMASLAALRQMERELMDESYQESNSGGMASLGLQTRPT